MLSRALGGKRKRGKERVTHRNFAKKYFLCTSKRHFNVSQSFSLKFCTCLSHKRKLLVCKSQLLFFVGFEIITKIEGAIFFETSCILCSLLFVGKHVWRSPKNKTVLESTKVKESQGKTCNCRDKQSCPLKGQCAFKGEWSTRQLWNRNPRKHKTPI